MKKLILFAGAAILVGAMFIDFSYAQTKTASQKSNVKLATTADTLSYALGIDYGLHAKSLDSTVDIAMIANSIGDVFSGDTLLSKAQAYEFLNDYFNVRIPAKIKAESVAWLAQIEAENPDVRKTESGLLYQIVAEGEGLKATSDNDQITVTYKGTLRDGTVFDSSEQHREYKDGITFALNHVIQGWTEGMKLVGKGGEITLWVPSDLGYGDRGTGNIPANAALRFDIKLLDVIPYVEEEVSADGEEYEDGYEYDQYEEMIQYPSYEEGYVWRLVKKVKYDENVRYDEDGNVWKKIKLRKKPAANKK